MSSDPFSPSWSEWPGLFDWSPWRSRTRFVPPLWYFHRTLATRPNEIDHRTEKSHVLEVDAVEWFSRENGASHSTDKYELVADRKACVVRRGDTFLVGIACKNRAFDSNRDKMKLIFEYGTYPSVPKGTKAVVRVNPSAYGGTSNGVDGPASGDWSAHLERRAGQRADIRVKIPWDVPVGLWRLTVATAYENRDKDTLVHKSKDPLYILFNPFNIADPVHLSHPSGRDEYLFNEVGKLYGGSHNNIKGRPWIFGQFRDSVLPAVCHVMGKVAKIRDSEMGDPVKVARAISAVVNSVNENGILTGRWDGNYEDGTRPFEWTGSVPILEEYMESGKPVKYGQCWVFAGVVATLCRTLGIPCRCVTNYISAHDTNNSLSIDKFYDENGEESTEEPTPVSAGSSGRRPDSVWNFHVWNEVWMARRDLDGPFGGWQVIDSTPQEESGGMHQLGPTSVEAVRRGEVGRGFDTAFVFTEVNADVFVYLKDEGSPWGYRIIDTNTEHVGKKIVTKAAGFMSDEAEDDYQVITDNYKQPEGSLQERLTMMSAVREATGVSGYTSAGLRLRYPGQKNQDVFLQLIDLDKGVYGEPYTIALFIHNQASNDRTLKVVMSTSSVFYTGMKAKLVKRGEGEFTMRPNERETLTMEVDPTDYMPKAVEYCQFRSMFLVRVRETGQVWNGEDDFVLQKPKLEVKASPDQPRVGRPCKITVRLVNPLREELTGCTFAIEAPGVSDVMRRRFRSIDPGERVELDLEVTPWRAGNTAIVAMFNSAQLYNVTGSKKVNVLG